MKFQAVVVCALAVPLLADEGLWLFNQFPKDQVRQKYNFEVSDSFLENLRLASLRIANGAGAFVSPQGLVLTNHHLVAHCVPKPEGFYAASQMDEVKCAGVEGEVLVGLEDVTKQVKEEGKPTGKAAEVLAKRNTAVARVEKACAEKSGNRCSVARLFSGERYDLYQYHTYNDLRLVFSPELGMAFFGGDAEHSTYQRYDLDIAFLRAYENGKPADTPHFLRWSNDGVKENDLIFSVGNPTGTSRMSTAAQLTFYRDTSLPVTLVRLQKRIEVLRSLKVTTPLLSEYGNAFKATAGKLIGLKDERLMARKQNFERKLRSSVEHDPKLGTEAGKVWDEVTAAYKNWTPNERAYQVLVRPGPIGSAYLSAAKDVARQADPVEIAMLAQYLEELKALGDKEAPLKAVLGSKTPQQVAEELVHTAKPGDEAALRIVKLLEEPARKLQKKYEETIEALEASSSERIAQYRFKVFGVNDYPDGTATPRVMFGAVKAYRDKTEAPVPFATTFGGLFHLADILEPYKLPQRWLDGKASLDLVLPFNFVSTADSAGGNSGNPAVNQKGEIVGVSFDGNIESIALTFLYSDEQARAVHVATQGMVESLRKLYKTPQLLRELGVPDSSL